MSVVELVLTVGTVARLTRLAQRDSILDHARRPLEARARRSESKVWELLWCPWCLSFWVAVAVVASWWEWGHSTGWLAATAVFTASYFTGLFAEHEEP